MTLVGGYRYTSPSANSILSPTNTIVNFVGFPLSGLSDSNAIACCMYKYDATNNIWVPYTG